MKEMSQKPDQRFFGMSHPSKMMTNVNFVHVACAAFALVAAVASAHPPGTASFVSDGCPGLAPDCGCDWTKNGASLFLCQQLCLPAARSHHPRAMPAHPCTGTNCPKDGRDDGSECFCRCCCSTEVKSNPAFTCKWNPPAPVPPPPPPPPPPPGVTSPTDMVKRMGIGINLGNTFDAPTEGSWYAASAASSCFFHSVRLFVSNQMLTPSPALPVMSPYCREGRLLQRQSSLKC